MPKFALYVLILITASLPFVVSWYRSGFNKESTPSRDVSISIDNIRGNEKAGERPSAPNMQKIDKTIEKFAVNFENYNISHDDLRALLEYLCCKRLLTEKQIAEAEEIFMNALLPNIPFALFSDEWVKFFNDAARGDYDTYYRDFDLEVFNMLKKDMNIASVGCGPGRNLWFFAKAVGDDGKVYAVDIDTNVDLFINLIRCKRYILYEQEFPQIVFVNNPYNDMRFYGEERIIDDESLDLIHMEDLHVIDDFFGSLRDPDYLPREERMVMRYEFIKSAASSLKQGGKIYIRETHRGDCFTVADRVKQGLDKFGLSEVRREKGLGKQKQVQVQVFEKR